MNLAIGLLSLLVIGVAGATALVWQRGRQARQAIRLDLHDRQLALDRRCDALGTRLDRLELGLRLGRLNKQVALARDRGLLSHAAANRLDTLVLDWHAEGLENHADGYADARNA